MPIIIEKKDEIEKRLNYIELKLNLLMEETESKTQFKYVEDDKGGNLVPKTVLEVWQDRSKKEFNQNNRRESFRNNDKNI